MALHKAITPLLLLALVACGGTRPTDLGAGPGGLRSCPATPNCVSSIAQDDEHRIEPFRIAGSPDAAWSALEAEIRAMPRTAIVTESPEYLHVEFTSALMRYVDDVEFALERGEGRIAVRSASRVGRSDLGVNRERIEEIRAALRAKDYLE